MKPTIKIIVVATIAVIAMIFAYFQITGYFQHQRDITRQRQSIQKSVAESSEAANDLLGYETNPSSITYGELISQGEDRVKKITDAILADSVSSLPDPEKDAVKEYLQGLRELLRYQVATNSKQVRANAELEVAKSAVKALSSANSYAFDSARENAKNALDEAKKAGDDWMESNRNFAKNVNDFRALRRQVDNELSGYDLVNDKTLASIADHLKVERK
jgi:hypothetical protein